MNASAAPDHPDFPLCLEFLTAIDLSAPDFVALAARHGFRRISLLANPMPPYRDFELLGDTPVRRETRRRCDELGVAVDMIEAFNLHAGTEAASFEPAMETGRYLGNEIINLLPREASEERIEEGFTRACELADAHGFRVVTEISRRATLKTLPQAVAFFQRIGRPDVRVLLDTLHFFRFGGTVDIARTHRDWIGRIQICDGPATMPDEEQLTEARQHRRVPGEGRLPLRELLSVIPTGITIGVEVPNRDYGTEERVRRSREGTLCLLPSRKTGTARSAP